jgi:putative DNA primase/helicase
MPTLLESALSYAAHGWPCYPVHSIRNGHCTCQLGAACDHTGKHPNGLLAPNGLNDATTDTAQITRWFAGNHANVAVATGPTSGLVVLDVDLRHGGFQTLKALTDQHGPLPKTPTSHTGGGGLHVLFAYQPVKSRPLADKPGLDIKGDGGSFVAPPSLHISGVRYAWQPDMGPDTPLAPIPDWLLELAKEAAKPLKTAKGEELHIPIGARHDQLLRYGCHLRHMGASEVPILAFLSGLNDHHCDEPLPAQDIRILAQDICKRYPPGGTNPPALPPVKKLRSVEIPQ